MDSHQRHSGVLVWIKGSKWQEKESRAVQATDESSLCARALRRTKARS